MFLNPITLVQQVSALYSIPRLSGKTHLFFSEPGSDEYVTGSLNNSEGQSRVLPCTKVRARRNSWAAASLACYNYPSAGGMVPSPDLSGFM